MTQLARIVEAFGSQTALGNALGVGVSAVSNWKRSGIPNAQKWRILELARERGLALSVEDLGLPPEAGTRSDDSSAKEAAA